MSEEINDVMDAPEEFEEAPGKKSNKTLWIILAIVAVIILCCCCFAITILIIIAASGGFEDLFYFIPALPFV